MMFLRVSDVATLLRCSEKTVRLLIADGRLRAINLKPDSSRGCWRVPQEALARLSGNVAGGGNTENA
jgi:excisionase family DNA binding protein